MKIQKVTAVYYSATGNTKQVTESIARRIGETLGVPVAADDFTLPQNRKEERHYG